MASGHLRISLISIGSSSLRSNKRTLYLHVAQSMKGVLEKSQHIEDEFGANLLHYAARNGDVTILQVWLKPMQLISD